jgi:hypothetical protein
MIELEKLEQMFANIRAKTSWNIDGPMLWGYFFTDPSEEKLQNAAVHLKSQGYRFVGTHETDDGNTRFLHVERIEVQSPQTLFARNEQLYELADRFGLESYDGMDVGPAPPQGSVPN